MNWFSRWRMYEEIKSFFNINNNFGKVLLVGGKSYIQNFFNPEKTEIILSNIPEVDIHKTPYENESFDYVIADQVLEHVEKPWVATEEVRRILKPNGIAILTSCLMNGIHWGPNDYWRFTPDGLKVLCKNYNKIEMASGWGNWESLLICNTEQRNAKVKKDTKLHKLASGKSDNYLIHVWIIARK